jgi:hypothetical protein
MNGYWPAAGQRLAPSQTLRRNAAEGGPAKAWLNAHTYSRDRPAPTRTLPRAASAETALENKINDDGASTLALARYSGTFGYVSLALRDIGRVTVDGGRSA